MMSLDPEYVDYVLPEELDRDIYIDYLQKAVRWSAAQALNLLCGCMVSTEDRSRSLNG